MMKLTQIRKLHKLESIQMQPTFRQDGATLLEAIAFLGIAAMVTLGAVSLLSGAFGSADAEKASGEVQALRTGMKKLATSDGGYTNASMANLHSLGAVPGTVKNNGTDWRNSFGGVVDVSGNTDGSFNVKYNNVPKQACVELVTKARGAWTSISIGGSAVSDFQLSTATTSCKDSNDMLFVGQ